MEVERKTVNRPTKADAIITSPNYHPHHSDPGADVILVSNCGLWFGVYSWYFSRASDFFNKISKTGKGIDHFVHPVKSESSARALDIFITGVFTLDTHIHFDRGDLPIIPDVMALCERFATPAIRRHTVTRLHQMCKDDPWRIFCLASQLQDEELAKKAIRFMHETEGPENQLDDLTSEESRGLSVDYLLALIRCRLGYNGDGSYRKTVKWKQVAIDFETSRFDRSVGSLYL